MRASLTGPDGPYHQLTNRQEETLARRTPRAQKTRDTILETALALFSARGYHGVTVEDIAAEAGLTKGAVYYWFTDKDDLGRDLQQHIYERLTQAGLRAVDPGDDAITNLRRAFEVYLDAVGSLGEARFFLRDAWTIPALEVGTRANERDAISLLRGVVDDGIAHSQIAPVDAGALAHALYGLLAESTLHVLTTGARDETLGVIDLFLGAIRPTPADASPLG